MNDTNYPCILCSKNVLNDAVECELCCKWVHRRCAKLTTKQLSNLVNNHFNCQICKESLPFHSIDTDEINYIYSHDTVSETITEVYQKYKTFEKTNVNEGSNVLDWDLGIDPDVNFLNETKLQCGYYTNEEFNVRYNSIKGLLIIHFNARSLKCNVESISNFLDTLDVVADVIAVSETWLRPHDDIHDVSMSGYNMYNTYRTTGLGGGTSLFVRDSLNVKEVPSYTKCINNVCECTTIEIVMDKGKNIVVGCFYRAPSSSIPEFCDELDLFLHEFGKKNLYVCGDFNIDLVCYDTNRDVKTFVDVLYSHSVYPTITRPTRVTINSATLIDNIFTNCIGVQMKSGIFCTDVSDHLPVFSICEEHKSKPRTSVMKRCFSETNVNKFQTCLQDVDWSNVLSRQDTNTAYDLFRTELENVFDKCFPLEKSKTKKVHKPWMTKGLVNACKKKHTLYKRFVTNRNAVTEGRYKLYKNKLVGILRVAKKNYYSELLELNKGNTKETWSIIKEVINKKTVNVAVPNVFYRNESTFKGEQNVANGFNDFFANIGTELASKIPECKEPRHIEDYMGAPNDKSMFIVPVNEAEVLSLCNTFTSKTSTDCMGLSMKLLKQVMPQIIQPFTHICNLSLSTGIFPDAMKIAKIIPLFKQGVKTEFSNYRPVSLLPQLSKLLEKLYEKRLVNFLETNCIINDSQFGFRKNRSTELALVTLLEYISKAMDKNLYTVGVFVDLRKAFDTLNFEVLLNKLNHIGIRGIANTWVRSYLTNRKQYVVINTASSKMNVVRQGVPQGSILGPILFLIYINDIVRVSQTMRLVLFADDTNLLKSGNDLKVLCNEVSMELQKLQDWFNRNKLSLNLCKTHFMVFTNRKNSEACNIVINKQKLDRVSSTKFLGVFIEEKLKWKQHIERVANKVAKSLSILYKAKDFVTKSALKTMYSSLVLPYLMYCSSVWGNTYKGSLTRLVTLQKKCVRLICGVHRLFHTTNLFKELGLLKFHDIVKVKTLVIMHKAYNQQLASEISNVFVKGNQEYTISTRQDAKFRITYVRTDVRSQAVTIIGPKLWNTLPKKISECASAFTFKSMLKQYYIASYTFQVY